MAKTRSAADRFYLFDLDTVGMGDGFGLFRDALGPTEMAAPVEDRSLAAQSADLAGAEDPAAMGDHGTSGATEILAADNITEGFHFSLEAPSGFAAARGAALAFDIDLSGLGKLHFGLADIYAEAQKSVAGLEAADRAIALLDFTSSNYLAHIADGMIAIDAVAKGGDGAGLLEQLKALGLRSGASFGAMAGGFIPIDALDEMAALDLLNFAQPVYTLTNVGTVTGQHYQSMNVDTAVTAYAGAGVNGTLNGTGITIGLISDSFNTRPVTLTNYAQDIASGDLPAGIIILADSPAGTDEGRAMAQAAYDVAPGISMAFSSANPSQAAFATAIVELAKPVGMGGGGARIVVDDVIYFAEPMFQDGIIAQAVGQATGTYGAMYFSSAGNQGTRGYDGINLADSLLTFNWTLDSTPADNGLFHLLDFDPGAGVDAIQTVSITGDTTFVFSWDQPSASAGGAGSATDIAIFLYLNPALPTTITNVIQTNNIGGDPFEGFSLSGSGSFGISIGVRDTNALPGIVKWIQFGPAAPSPEYANFAATSYGHSNAASAISVGASDWADSPRELAGGPYVPGEDFPYAEVFTSKGGTPILFDGTGARLMVPIDRGAVDLTASDGGNNTFFGGDAPYDPDSFPNFYGTSQAAPNAAAVAALLMQKFPGATNAEIELALKQSAIDIKVNYNGVSTNAGIGIGTDPATGVGLIQADSAVLALAAITNDAPVIGVEDLAGAVSEQVGPPVGNITDSGTIAFTDADGVWAHIVSPTGTPVGPVVGALTAVVTSDTAADGSGGLVTWTYTVAAAAVEYLAAGETKVDSFTIVLDDQFGATITKTIAVTVTGTGDAPVISAVTTDAISAALNETNAGLLANGTLTVVDPDTTDSVTPSVVSVAASGVTTGLLSNPAALLAMLSVSPPSIPADTGATHNLNWAFNSGSEAFNYLDEGEVLTLAYTVRATDNGALFDDQTVTVTITGSNDGPSLAVVSPSDSDSAAITDGTGPLLVQGSLTASDPDLSDTLAASVPVVFSMPAFFGAFPFFTIAPASLAGDPGPASPANLGWSFLASGSTFDYLAAGETQLLRYTVRVVDDSGGFADRDVEITITGINEAPVITSAVPPGTAVVEIADGDPGENSANLSGGGLIAFADTDLSNTHSATVLANGPGYLGNFVLSPVDQVNNNLSWTFSVSDSALNSLAQGSVLTQSYTVSVGDGQGGFGSVTILVNLIGSNDAAILSSANVLVTQGLVPVTAGGTLTITDEDNPALFQPLVATPGTYGSLSLEADGDWSYAANGPLLALAPTDVVTDSFTVHAVDGTPTTITVSIAGSNDVAIARVDHFTTDEASAIGSGLSLFDDNGGGADTDPDSPLAVAAVNGDPAFLGTQIMLASGALLTVNADGTFHYDPNDAFNTLTLASGAVNQSAFDSFTYSLAGGSMATVFVNVTALNSVDDLLKGNGLNNVVTGFDPSGDTFRLEQGGNDSAIGLGGNDGFYFGAAFGSGDSVDGGGGSDTLAVQGHTDADFGNVTDIDVILAVSGSDPQFGDTADNRYDYDLQTWDGNVAAGQILTLSATGLLPGEDMHFDGSAETDGAFRMFAGRGNDVLLGGAGNDGFFFGADGNLTGADRVNGGGGIDSLAVRGDYTGANAIVLANASLAGIEVIAFLTGHNSQFGGPIAPAGFDYDMTMADGNVAAGQRLDVIATGLAADESLRFDGRPETNGSFRILSGAGDDLIWGGAGNDTIFGGRGADRLIGGAGADIFLYGSAAESTSTGFDTIVGFDWHVDRIDAPGGVRAIGPDGGGSLSAASFDADLAAGLAGVLGAGQAALFAATAGTFAGRIFAVIDANGVAGYQAGQDLVIELVNAVSPIDPTAGVII